jgi:hypothetical protein
VHWGGTNGCLRMAGGQIARPKGALSGSASTFTLLKGGIKGCFGVPAGAVVELRPNRHVADGKAQGACEVTAA